jgi:HAD superfamily hydrolase (TIGR01509 family)
VRDIVAALGSARAVLFDVDGTLYHQSPVRRAMVRRLVRAHARRPARGARTMRILAAYRSAQETMRESGFVGDVDAEQRHRAAVKTGASPDEVGELVEQWMEAAPLDAIAAHARPGLVDVLDQLADRGVALGVVSDYPADRKLAALGVAGRFAVVVSAQDPRVQAFKPSPRGLLAALGELGVSATDAVYVGDRPGVDDAAAAAANMRCVLVGDAHRTSKAVSPAGAPVLEEAS